MFNVGVPRIKSIDTCRKRNFNFSKEEASKIIVQKVSSFSNLQDFDIYLLENR